MLIDTHAHLDMSHFDNDRDAVIQNAHKKGIKLIVNVGTCLSGSEKSIALAEKYDFIYAAVGIHPHEADNITNAALDDLEKLISHKKVIAVGEIGLDYYKNYSAKKSQISLFTKLLDIAKQHKKPIIVHCRDAQKDTIQLLKSAKAEKLGGILHCFSGDEKMMREVTDLGFYISFAGQVTYPSAASLLDVARVVPTQKILVETDCPFLSPQIKRGQRNEPSYITHTIEKIASIRRVSPDDLKRVVETNFFSLFPIKKYTVQKPGKISYKIRNSLYLNITNRCSNECSFCSKFNSYYVQGHNLELGHEPSFEEIIDCITHIGSYDEVVFCGFGEPTLRLEIVKKIAQWLKDKGKKVRLNTNGHGNVIHKKNILPSLSGLIDSISISLNAHNEETYNKLCRPNEKKGIYKEVLDFIIRAKESIPEVTATVIDIPDIVDIKKCEHIVKKKLGVHFRIRRHNMVGA